MNQRDHSSKKLLLFMIYKRQSLGTITMKVFKECISIECELINLHHKYILCHPLKYLIR